jgi:glycosyltransferase involved in cell wall biosynthesis
LTLGMAQAAGGGLTWSLCVCTLNRPEILAQCVALAAAQTRPPAEVVIVDSSDAIDHGRDLVTAALAAKPDIRLIYERSEIKSSTTQRNRAIDLCAADVLFVIDDDSFMHPECAEEVMKVYEADVDGRIAAVSAENVPVSPLGASGTPDAKDSGRRRYASVAARARSSGVIRWIATRILFQSKNDLFLFYDLGAEPHPIPESVRALDVAPLELIGGCVMTVRRAVADRERFDAALRYYAAFEDLDASRPRDVLERRAFA